MSDLDVDTFKIEIQKPFRIQLCKHDVVYNYA